MTRFLQPVYLPIVALFAVILINKFGGNDKAPFLALGAGLLSFGMAVVYMFTLRPLKAMIAFAPGAGLLVLFILAKLGLVDLMPILGFR